MDRASDGARATRARGYWPLAHIPTHMYADILKYTYLAVQTEAVGTRCARRDHICNCERFRLGMHVTGTDNMDAQSTVTLLHFGITLICFAHVPLVFCACTVSLVGNMLSLKTHQRNTQQIMCYARFSNEFQKSRVWLVHMFASNALRTCSAKVVGAGRLSSR